MLQLNDWQRRASEQRFIDQAIIGGRRVAAASGATFASIDPATGRLLANVAACGEAEVDLAVRTARASFESGVWSRCAPRERQQKLLRLAELILANRDELALLDSLNMGKPVMDAWNIDVPGAAGVFRWYAESIDKLYDQVAPTAPDALATITREALGVVAAVVPWNFPLDMAAWKLAPALAAGNSVVLKPAEQSPFSALRLAELDAALADPAVASDAQRWRRLSREQSEVAGLVDAGRVRSTLTEVMGRIDAANLKRAHALLESGTARGKIVLEGF